MALGAFTKYDQLESVLFADAGRQWDNATAGSCMWCLAGAAYAPTNAHTVTSDVGGALITSGDGAPINVTTPALDKTTTPGTTFYDADSADFGATVTITAKWLLLVQPVTAGAFSATTGKLLGRVDLNTANSSATVSSTLAQFKIDPAVNGWFKTV